MTQTNCTLRMTADASFDSVTPPNDLERQPRSLAQRYAEQIAVADRHQLHSFTPTTHQSRRRLGSALGRLNRKKASGGGGAMRDGPIRRLLHLQLNSCSATKNRNSIEPEAVIPRCGGSRWSMGDVNQKYYSHPHTQQCCSQIQARMLV